MSCSSLSRLLPPLLMCLAHGAAMGPGWARFPGSVGQSMESRGGAPGGAPRAAPGRLGTGMELDMWAPAQDHPPLLHEQFLGTFLLDDISQGIEKRKKKALFSQYKSLQH